MARALLITALIVAAGCSSTPTEPPLVERGPTPHTRGDVEHATTTAQVEDLEFLAGRWLGEGFGGEVEECWAPPLGGAMLGTFRLLEDGEPVFYELLTLVRDGEHVRLRLKHFDPDLTGWEQPGAEHALEFTLIRLAGTTAWFDGLTLHRDGDRLLGYLAMDRGGTVEEVEFRFHLE